MNIAPSQQSASAPSQDAMPGEAGDALRAVKTPSLDFECLLRRHQAMVFSIARNYLCDAGRAEDIAQDVFLQLHGELHRLETEQHVVAWLRRVTAHRSIDALRSPARSRATALDAVAEREAPSAEDDVLLRERLRRLVANLPVQQRLAVILRYQEDLHPSEIAEVLGMPVATVKSHLRRALDCLRQKTGGLRQKTGHLWKLPVAKAGRDSDLRETDE